MMNFQDYKKRRLKRKIVLYVAIFLGLALVFSLYGQQAANSAERRTVTRSGDYTMVVRQGGIGLPCPPTHPNGKMFFWKVWQRVETQDLFHLHVFTFGPWNGRLCANGNHIWTAGEPFFAREPSHTVNTASNWQFDAGSKRISDFDNVLPTIHRTWRAHFYSRLGVFTRHCHPRLTVTLSPLPSPVRLGGDEHCDPNIQF